MKNAARIIDIATQNNRGQITDKRGQAQISEMGPVIKLSLAPLTSDQLIAQTPPAGEMYEFAEATGSGLAFCHPCDNRKTRSVYVAGKPTHQPHTKLMIHFATSRWSAFRFNDAMPCW